MFPTSVFGRSTRAIAAGALIFSLTATTLVGSANAAPLANTESCAAASAARNDAVHALHDAWKASTSDLKALSNGTPGLRHEVMSSWHDLKDVLMQAVQDLRALGLVSACRDENESTTPAVVSATTDQAVKDIVDKAIKDLQAIVDAARKSVASQTAAKAPKDSTKSEDADDPEDSTADAEPKDQTEGANGDEDKDHHDTDEAQDEDRNANNEDKDDDDAKDNSSEKSKATSTMIAKAKTLATAANAARLKRDANRHGHDHERERD